MSRSANSEQRILEAARKIFLAEGYSAVSTDQLCREASVSKTTLYRYFGDMAGVLKALVKTEGDAFSIDNQPLPATAEAFWLALRDYGAQLLRLLNSDFCAQLDQTMHEEARQHPDIAKLFYQNAYGRSHEEMTRLIEHAKQSGFIQHESRPSDLADYLISMWEGLTYVRVRLSLESHPYTQPKRRSESVIRALFSTENLPY